ncbi:MAG: hypothetical protein Q8N03_06890 [Ignavibacteria bacterium]|nr:hypothetical protein [Ignavibacteria bacterium]
MNIFFLLVYLAGTTGFTIITHYCGGEIDSVSIFRNINDSDACECEGNSCCEPCCDDEVKNIKIEDSHTIGVKYLQLLDISFVPHYLIVESTISYFESKRNINPNYNLPPPDEPAFIRYHSFLI